MANSGHTVELTRHAEKDLDALRGQAKQEAVEAIDRLEDDPLAGHLLTGSLKGCRSLEFSVPGSGAYRAVYIVVEPDRVCLVFIVGPHENIYLKAQRRVKAVQRKVRRA